MLFELSNAVSGVTIKYNLNVVDDIQIYWKFQILWMSRKILKNQQISFLRIFGKKGRMITVDTVFESWNTILYILDLLVNTQSTFVDSILNSNCMLLMTHGRLWSIVHRVLVNKYWLSVDQKFHDVKYGVSAFTCRVHCYHTTFLSKDS